MALFSCLHTRALSWWLSIPLPANDASASPIFQSWHEFDNSSNQWCQMKPTRGTSKTQDGGDVAPSDSRPLRLATWNVDSTSPLAGLRIEAVLSRILSLSPPVDIIFLQELSRGAISQMLDDTRLRQNWFLSDTENAVPGGQSFTSMTLLSKARFGDRKEDSQNATLGLVWRVKYPSRFGRDALCCDVFVPSASPTRTSRIRLINVHLDSLPIQPSRRPDQISTIASYLRSAGRGIVAGDFNPVLPEDASLVETHSLVDAWDELQPGETGFTWGIDGKQPFPPIRMDKVAALGLKLQDIDIYHPETVNRTAAKGKGDGQEQGEDWKIPWSDHSGLSCTFGLER